MFTDLRYVTINTGTQNAELINFKNNLLVCKFWSDNKNTFKTIPTTCLERLLWIMLAEFFLSYYLLIITKLKFHFLYLMYACLLVIENERLILKVLKQWYTFLLVHNSTCITYNST